jgi:hypothetical protein
MHEKPLAGGGGETEEEGKEDEDGSSSGSSDGGCHRGRYHMIPRNNFDGGVTRSRSQTPSCLSHCSTGWQ